MSTPTPTSSEIALEGRGPLRPLLPATTSAPLAVLHTPAAPQGPQPSKKRTVVAAACGECRKKKRKCDSNRPCCHCAKRNVECQYETHPEETRSQALKRKFGELQSHKSASEELCDLLRYKPADDVARILQMLRSGAEAESIVRQVHDGDLLLQLHVVPESRLRYDLPYGPSLLALVQQDSGNLYLQSYFYQDSASETENPRALQSRENGFEDRSPYLKPFQGAELVEPLLTDTNISDWTAVTSNEALLNSLMRYYFMHHYSSWPFFHKDHFLEDLKAGRRRFCSSLLVNTILADACHGAYKGRHRNVSGNQQTLGYLFLSEARRLWELEITGNKITTIQAAMVMTINLNMEGIDKVGYVYSKQAVIMAQALDLFKKPKMKDEKTKTVYTFTAWAVFSWQAVCTYHYLRPPLLSDPPEAPLPDPLTDAGWYGELRFKYPSSQIVWSAHQPQLCHATFRIRRIMTDMAKPYVNTNPRISPEHTLSFYLDLRMWFESLPTCLNPQNIVLPQHIQLHIHFYDLVVSLFEVQAVSQIRDLPPLPLATANISQSSSEVVAEAGARINTLMRIYYFRHSFQVYNATLSYLLSIYSFGILRELKRDGLDKEKTEAIHSSVALAMKGIDDQAEFCNLARILGRLVRDSMGKAGVSIPTDNSQKSAADPDDLSVLQNVHAELPINIPEIADKPETRKRIDDIINGLAGTNLESNISYSSPPTQISPK